MADFQTDVTGMVATFVSAAQHTTDGLEQAVVERGYQGAWVAIAELKSQGAPNPVLRLDVVDVNRGAPVPDQTLLSRLSHGGKAAALVVGGELVLFVDGKVVAPEDAPAICKAKIGIEAGKL